MSWLANIFRRKQHNNDINYANLVRSFGAILEATSDDFVKNANVLPVSKELLEKVLLINIKLCRDPKEKEYMIFGYVSLGDFIEMSEAEQDTCLKHEMLSKKIGLLSEVDNNDVDMDALGLMVENTGAYTALMGKVEKQRSILTEKLNKAGLI